MRNLLSKANSGHMPLSIANKAAHSGFETNRRHHNKSKTGVTTELHESLYQFRKQCFWSVHYQFGPVKKEYTF